MTAAYRTRADRLELEQRLQAAGRAAELLHNKEEALGRDRVRRQGYATRAAERWTTSCGDADRAVALARVLGASDELTRLVDASRPTATMSVDWRQSMGLATPGQASVDPGPPPAVSSTAALGPAIDAVRDALREAATAAATAEAVRRLDLELAATRRRRRAIEERLMPRLTAARHELDLQLDERERDEALRIRLAGARRTGGTS